MTLWNHLKTILAVALHWATALLAYLTGVESLIEIIEHIWFTINKIRIMITPFVVFILTILGKKP